MYGSLGIYINLCSHLDCRRLVQDTADWHKADIIGGGASNILAFLRYDIGISQCITNCLGSIYSDTIRVELDISQVCLVLCLYLSLELDWHTLGYTAVVEKLESIGTDTLYTCTGKQLLL